MQLSGIDQESVAAEIARMYRTEYGTVLAALIAWLRDFELAEEVLQDALVRALETWPTRGIPPNLAAWVTTAARRKALDRLGRTRTGTQKEQQLAEELARNEHKLGSEEYAMQEGYAIPDERLKTKALRCWTGRLPYTARDRTRSRLPSAPYMVRRRGPKTPIGCRLWHCTARCAATMTRP